VYIILHQNMGSKLPKMKKNAFKISFMIYYYYYYASLFAIDVACACGYKLFQAKWIQLEMYKFFSLLNLKFIETSMPYN